MADIKNVSTLGIADGIDYLQSNFINKLDENVQEAVNAYKNLQSQEILSSANIDSITSEIQAKVTQLQNDFDELGSNLKQGMFQSQEAIESHRSELENQLSNGTY